MFGCTVLSFILVLLFGRNLAQTRDVEDLPSPKLDFVACNIAEPGYFCDPDGMMSFEDATIVSAHISEALEKLKMEPKPLVSIMLMRGALSEGSMKAGGCDLLQRLWVDEMAMRRGTLQIIVDVSLGVSYCHQWLSRESMAFSEEGVQMVRQVVANIGKADGARYLIILVDTIINNIAEAENVMWFERHWGVFMAFILVLVSNLVVLRWLPTTKRRVDLWLES